MTEHISDVARRLSNKINANRENGIGGYDYINQVELIQQALNATAAEARRDALVCAAKLATRVPAEHMSMGYEQKMYGWHEIMDALTKASDAIRNLIDQPGKS